MMYIIFKDEAEHWIMLREDQLRYINYSDKYLMIMNCDTCIVYLEVLTSLYTYGEASSMIASIAAEDGDDLLDELIQAVKDAEASDCKVRNGSDKERYAASQVLSDAIEALEEYKDEHT